MDGWDLVQGYIYPAVWPRGSLHNPLTPSIGGCVAFLGVGKLESEWAGRVRERGFERGGHGGEQLAVAGRQEEVLWF